MLLRVKGYFIWGGFICLLLIMVSLIMGEIFIPSRASTIPEVVRRSSSPEEFYLYIKSLSVLAVLSCFIGFCIVPLFDGVEIRLASSLDRRNKMRLGAYCLFGFILFLMMIPTMIKLWRALSY